MTLETALLCRNREAARDSLALILEHFEEFEAIAIVDDSLSHLDEDTVRWFMSEVASPRFLACYEHWLYQQLDPSEPHSLLELCASAIPAFLEMLAECQDPLNATLWRRQITDDINLCHQYRDRERLIQQVLDSIRDSPELVELFQDLIKST